MEEVISCQFHINHSDCAVRTDRKTASPPLRCRPLARWERALKSKLLACDPRAPGRFFSTFT
jgi:hypothetical protein